MREPEVRGEGVVGCCGDYAIFEDVAGGEAEDADGFDADVLIGGGAYYGGVGGRGEGGGGGGGRGAPAPADWHRCGDPFVWRGGVGGGMSRRHDGPPHAF